MWRIDRICNSGYKRVSVTNIDMISRLAAVILVDVAFVVAVALFSEIESFKIDRTPAMHGYVMLPDRNYCRYGRPQIHAALLATEGFSIIILVFMTWRVRGAPSQLNDSRQVAIGSAGSFVLLLSYLPWFFDLVPSDIPSTQGAITFCWSMIWLHLTSPGYKIMSVVMQTSDDASTTTVLSAVAQLYYQRRKKIHATSDKDYKSITLERSLPEVYADLEGGGEGGPSLAEKAFSNDWSKVCISMRCNDILYHLSCCML